MPKVKLRWEKLWIETWLDESGKNERYKNIKSSVSCHSPPSYTSVKNKSKSDSYWMKEQHRAMGTSFKGLWLEGHGSLAF